MKGFNFKWKRRNAVGNIGFKGSFSRDVIPPPPPPSLPGVRRFSLAGSSGNNLQALSASASTSATEESTVPVIPIAAFEIVPGAEYSDVEDDSAPTERPTTTGFELTEPLVDNSTNDDDQVDENTGKTTISTNNGSSPLMIGNGLSALAALLQRRRGSSATVSSWMDDQTIYDEAEVRSELPCFAIMDSASMMDMVADPLPAVPPESQAKRVVVIALETVDVSPLTWSIANTILQPKRDLVIVVNVRPEVVISSAVEGGVKLGTMIEDDNKKSSHGFLKTQIEVLANHAIPAKGLALRGDPRRSIIRTIYELDADLLILGPHHQENAVSLPVSAGKRGLGSVSDYVLRNAACSVLIAKEKQMVPSWRAL